MLLFGAKDLASTRGITSMRVVNLSETDESGADEVL